MSTATGKRMHIVIATPLRACRGPEDLPPQIGATIRELIARKSEHDYTFEFMAACGGLCSARNRLVHEALTKTDAQIIKWWDADLHDQNGRDADAVLRQLGLMRNQGCHILGRLYTRRLAPSDKRPKWCANWIHEAEIQPEGLLQVAELGMGAAGISRKCYDEVDRIYVRDVGPEQQKAGMQPMSYRDRDTGEMITAHHQIRLVDQDLLSEDYWFMYLARCAQIPIWADTVARCRQKDGDQLYPALGQQWPPIPAETKK